MNVAGEEAGSFTNLAAYKFLHVAQPMALKEQLIALTDRLQLKGTILLGEEGINLFVAGSDAAVEEFISSLRKMPGLEDLETKLSYSQAEPFRRMHVKVKKEIIAFGVDGIQPAAQTSRKLKAKELCQWLDEGRDVTLLDVRNDYEVRLGTFKNAVPIGVENFRELPTATGQLDPSTKKRPMVMFCTGGIRCEKAGPFMEEAGFEDVYQLDGGILRYFEECGGKHYDGECFVFDHRVSLDSDLEPTEAKLCFVCRAPLTVEDQQSDNYVPNESCPFCYVEPHERIMRTISHRQQRLAEIAATPPGCTPYENRRFLTVAREMDGSVLIDFLMETFPFPGVEAWQKRIDDQLVRRGGEPLAANTILAHGDRIENLFPNTIEPRVNCDIQIIYEDDSIVVVNKPAPLPMHPCGRFNKNTLNWILNEAYRPQKLRLAHRLDANTTGVVVFSRTKNVARTVQSQFQVQGQVQKSYFVRVQGVPSWSHHVCDAAIGRQKLGRMGARMIVDEEDGQEARTEFELIRALRDETALLRARPVTGRTNQIRIHAAHLGFPVVGDPTYLANGEYGTRQTLDYEASQMCLHAARIEFDHPDGYRTAFEAEPPAWALEE